MEHSFVRPALAAIAIAAVLGACKPAETPPPAAAEITVTGVLTSEGVECPALRDGQGNLYTLTPADLHGYRPGDAVCVKGKRAEMSTCQQGTTIVVQWIGRADQCP